MSIKIGFQIGPLKNLVDLITFFHSKHTDSKVREVVPEFNAKFYEKTAKFHLNEKRCDFKIDRYMYHVQNFIG